MIRGDRLTFAFELLEYCNALEILEFGSGVERFRVNPEKNPRGLRLSVDKTTATVRQRLKTSAAFLPSLALGGTGFWSLGLGRLVEFFRRNETVLGGVSLDVSPLLSEFSSEDPEKRQMLQEFFNAVAAGEITEAMLKESKTEAVAT